MRSTTLAFALTAMLAGSLAHAEVATLLPVKDASLFEPDVPEDQLSGGGGSLFIGRTGSGRLRRTMMNFDLASAIPAGSTITSVRIELSVSRTQVGGYPATVHRLLSDWGEGTTVGSRGGAGGAVAQAGDATWTHRFWPTDLWVSPGGDFAPEVICEQTLAGIGRYTFESEALLLAVQDMLAHPETNFGFMWVGDEINGITAKRVNARNSTSTANRPVMVVTYVPGCRGDWNRDGAVDGDDVIAFFGGWDNGNADFDGSGATDFNDVVGFMTTWDNGCP